MNSGEFVGPDDIVITGYGAITPLGHDVESYYQSLMRGESAVGLLAPKLRVDGTIDCDAGESRGIANVLKYVPVVSAVL